MKNADFEKTIRIMDPETYFDITSKRTIDEKTGRLKNTRYYLSANLWFGAKIHYHTQKKINDFCKNYLLMYCQGLPKLDKLRIKITYFSTTPTFDLDNKAFFWMKIFLDLLKTPTNKQLLAAQKKGYKIIHLDILHDDNVQFVDSIKWKYKNGPHELRFELKGRKSNVQKRLFI